MKLMEVRCIPHCAILAAIFLLGLFLRIYKINEYSFWCDEMMQAAAASRPWEGMLYAVSRHSSPPLDYILTKAVMLAFGSDDWVLRMPAFVWGLLSLPLFYRIARAVAGRDTALCGTALFSLSPMAVSYSHEARMYSLFLLLSLASVAAVMQLDRKKSFASCLLLGAVNGMLLLTHYFGFFFIVSETCFMLARLLRSYDRARQLEQLAASMAISFALFLPWLPFFIVQLSSQGDIAYGLSGNLNFFIVFLARFTTDSIHPALWSWLCLLFFCSGAAIACLKREQELLLALLALVALLGGLYAVAVFRKVVTPQNAIFLLPVFLLISARGIAGACSLLKMPPLLAASLTALLFLWPAVSNHSTGTKCYRQPWKQACEYIRQHARPGERIYITDPVARGFLAYYADPRAEYAVMNTDWVVCRNVPSWRIWVISDDVISQMQGKRFAGWVVVPSFFMSRPNTLFMDTYRELLGPAIKTFGAGLSPLQIFYIQPEGADAGQKG